MELLWNTLHFLGMGLQIAVAFVGGVLTFSWVRVRGNRLEVSTERLGQVRCVGAALLWVLATGFMLELWYEIHLLQID